MSEPFLGEIRMMAFNFAPNGWSQCGGHILPIAQNQSLYSLLGTTYGGDGETTFGLPDLRGRAPIHFGSRDEEAIALGEKGGAESHTLTTAEMAAHSHGAQARAAAADVGAPPGNAWAAQTTNAYAATPPDGALHSGAITSTGGGQSHTNIQPYLTLNFCIALQGLFPSSEDTSPDADRTLGEIRMFAGNFAPYGYAFCNGQLLPLSQNTALFSLLGTTYGGDGRTTFALPDLRTRAPIHWGTGPGLGTYNRGAAGGAATVTLQSSQLPQHSHTAVAANATGTQTSPVGHTWGQGVGRTPPRLYSSAGPDTGMHADAIGQTGGGQPHNNRQPYQAINFIIALTGTYLSG
ncbi:MAG: tail fiber protein [Caldilineaceae bacterium]|nr:tail fiber protein [Caldilineaceae bacterium]